MLQLPASEMQMGRRSEHTPMRTILIISEHFVTTHLIYIISCSNILVLVCGTVSY